MYSQWSKYVLLQKYNLSASLSMWRGRVLYRLLINVKNGLGTQPCQGSFVQSAVVFSHFFGLSERKSLKMKGSALVLSVLTCLCWMTVQKKKKKRS